IYYPIKSLINVGINDIIIVTGGQFAGDFLKLLGNGKEFGLEHINYTYQEGEGGIADALSLCEYYAQGESVCVVLGDNIIEKNLRSAVDKYRAAEEKGAMILLKEVEDPHRFGVAEIKADKITKIVEKPKNPASNYAVTGFYMYDSKVFDFIKTLNPSARGELEITDVNNKYLSLDELKYDFLDGWWTDAGTFDSLHRASNLVATTGANKI
ncbi:MAG: sugar phosphate nucleotidyltransferase, partial [bacterium]|nr:sugar phosphate nucleotidyltransferase [bacterium]